MTKTEYVLDSLADDEEAKKKIMEYFVFCNVNISEEELDALLDKMVADGLIIVNRQWQNEKREFPYALTTKGREIWNAIEE